MLGVQSVKNDNEGQRLSIQGEGSELSRRPSVAFTQMMLTGVCGPCSFDDCKKPGIKRCAWKNRMRFSTGGCDELFCEDHAFTPPGASKPVCCTDCQTAWGKDKRCGKIIIFVVIGIILLLAATAIVVAVLVSDSSKDEDKTTVPDVTVDATSSSDTKTESTETATTSDSSTTDAPSLDSGTIDLTPNTKKEETTTTDKVEVIKI